MRGLGLWEGVCGGCGCVQGAQACIGGNTFNMKIMKMKNMAVTFEPMALGPQSFLQVVPIYSSIL